MDRSEGADCRRERLGGELADCSIEPHEIESPEVFS